MVWLEEKQAGAELKKKKRFFGPKIWEIIEYKGKKLTNFQKKKKTFWAKNWEKGPKSDKFKKKVVGSKIDQFSKTNGQKISKKKSHNVRKIG